MAGWVGRSPLAEGCGTITSWKPAGKAVLTTTVVLCGFRAAERRPGAQPGPHSIIRTSAYPHCGQASPPELVSPEPAVQPGVGLRSGLTPPGLIVLRPLLSSTPPLPLVLPVVPGSVPTEPLPAEPVPADPVPAEPEPELPEPPITGATESRPLEFAPPAVCAMAEPARPMERRDIAMSLQDMMFSCLLPQGEPIRRRHCSERNWSRDRFTCSSCSPSSPADQQYRPQQSEAPARGTDRPSRPSMPTRQLNELIAYEGQSFVIQHFELSRRLRAKHRELLDQRRHA